MKNLLLLCLLGSATIEASFSSNGGLSLYDHTNNRLGSGPRKTEILTPIDRIIDHYKSLIEFKESSFVCVEREYYQERKLIKEESLRNAIDFAQLISKGIGEVVLGAYKYSFDGVSEKVYAIKEQYEKASKLFEFIGYNNPFDLEEILTFADKEGKNYSFVEEFMLKGREKYEKESAEYKEKIDEMDYETFCKECDDIIKDEKLKEYFELIKSYYKQVKDPLKKSI